MIDAVNSVDIRTLFIYLFIDNIRHEALARPNIGKQSNKGLPRHQK